MQDVSGQRGARPPGSQVSCITEGGGALPTEQRSGRRRNHKPQPTTTSNDTPADLGPWVPRICVLAQGQAIGLDLASASNQRQRVNVTASAGRHSTAERPSSTLSRQERRGKWKKGKRKKETATQQHSNTASVDTRQALGSSTAHPFGYIDPPRARDFAQFQKRAAEMLDGDWPVRIHNAYCQHSISPYPHPSPFAVTGGRSLSSSRQGVCQRGRSPRQSPEAPIDGHHR